MSMDALEFFKGRKRMCRRYEGCIGCPLEETGCASVVSSLTSDADYMRIVAAVERWSSEHPRKTRQSVFLGQWPNCKMDDEGVIGVCPRNVNKMHVCGSVGCADCRREFWMQEVE